MKATEVIKRDHRAAEALFEEFKRADKEKRAELEDEVFEALETHEAMEGDYFYSALKGEMENEEMFQELEAEQKALAGELERIKNVVDGRDEEIIKFMETVLEHAKEEEEELFPEAEECLDEKELEELGAKMEPESAVANAKK